MNKTINILLSLIVVIAALCVMTPAQEPTETVETVAVKTSENDPVSVEKQQSKTSDPAIQNADAVRDEKTEALNRLRTALIIEKAKSLRYVDPRKAVELVPAAITGESEIESFLKARAKENPQLTSTPNFCSLDFTGEKYTFDVPTPIKLSTLLNDLRFRFGINFLPDAELADATIQVSVTDVPWNLVLRSQLSYLDIEATCLDDNTISLIKRQKLLTLQESIRRTAPTRTVYVKLKYLRPSTQPQVNLAGRPSGATATLETLEQEITKILRAGGDSRGTVARIPGTSELIITGTDAQIAEIEKIIEKADKPSYRVQVYALVYTINENKLRDVGSQFSAIVGTGDLRQLGGASNLPSGQGNSGGGSGNGNGSGNGSNTQPGAIVPGGVRTFGQGFSTPSQNTTILAASATLGTAQFAYQLSLLEQLGVARRVEKLRIETRDGSTGTFESGRQIPVIVQAANNLGGGAPGQLEFINAGSSLSATPQVILGEDDKPYLINLAFRAESNNVDTSIVTGGVPSVNGRRVQSETMFLINQVYVLAASNDASESASESRAPGIGQIPLIGELFKRRVRQKSEDKLYFAFWVEVSYSDSTSTIPTNNLDPTFPIPPPMKEQLKVDKKKKEK